MPGEEKVIVEPQAGAAGAGAEGAKGTESVLDPKGDAGKEQGGAAADKGDAGSVKDPKPDSFLTGLAPDDAKLFKDKGWKVPADSLKSYREIESKLGKAIVIPDEKASKEEQDAFFTKLGRPGKADDYKVEVPKELAHMVNPDTQKAFRGVAHEIGLTQKQVDALVAWQGRDLAGALEKMGAGYESTMKTLKDEWGAAAERNIGLAKRMVNEMGGKDLVAYLSSTGLGNHPALVKAFAKAGALLAEDGVMSDEFEGITGPQGARDQIAEVMSADKKTHPYWNASNPGHKEAVRKMAELHQMAYPEE